jgi:DNA invertase Pin-like site-specific DNA recombinase
MNKIINVAAYCRVSTDLADQLNSLSTQIKYFTEYISQHEGWRLKEVYYDEGISGTSVKKREGFNRMIGDAENGEISLILTKEVSRFARNTIDTLSYTRKLSSLGIGMIFMNDGIDTRDKDGELRLTIMASIAQEESRKTSERVKWGMRRKMEQGRVLGHQKMLGFRLENQTLVIVPEEAEVVRKIFNMYVHEKKGGHTIAKELNTAGIFNQNGNYWYADSISRLIKNDKYVGDLTQWKKYCTDFLTKTIKKNTGDNPNEPLIFIKNHHEGIIDRETWNLAQAQLEERVALTREGRRHSQRYWYSSKLLCGKCGTPFASSCNKSAVNRTLLCRCRTRIGTPHKIADGSIIGCDNKGVNSKLLYFSMKYVLSHIQSSQDTIINDLLAEIKLMQKSEEVIDIKVFEDEIAKIESKKSKAIDLMLEDLISKEDLKKQTAFYDSEITRLSLEMNQSQNINHVHDRQINNVKAYIKEVKKTAKLDVDNSELYGELLEKFLSYDNNVIEVYLKCVPFGFRINYHIYRYNEKQQYNIYVDDFSIIA